MKKTWTEQQSFALEPALGAFHGVEEFNIQPLFTWKQVDGQWELKGLYKLMVRAEIQDEREENGDFDASVTQIDDVDRENTTAYFEYALPFHVYVDIDKVANNSQPSFELISHDADYDSGCIHCSWQASVAYEEAEAAVESTSAYYEIEDAIEAWQESTIEVPEVEAVHPDQLPKWKDTYTTIRIPLKSHHGRT
ncbi:hypothetical protein ACFO0S_13115 [Chryseomicrobium palamuruense]|uniref:Bacterial transcription activator effector binding domain-containing protein n=1 Tax=Chryseomicrobium palamuruense TaxID=682973 RepID=A0ABV8UYE1_9BACL